MTTSTFDKQAAASLDMIDKQAAAERVQQILHPEMGESINAAKEAVAYANSPIGKRIAAESRQAGPTFTPQPQTQPQAPATRNSQFVDVGQKFPISDGETTIYKTAPRKTRSDKGTHKPKAPTDPDEIVLRMSIDKARTVALLLGGSYGQESALIQDQIIAQLQRRLDQLQKGVK